MDYSLEEYYFGSIYELAELIDKSVNNEIEFWNYNQDFFINSARKFTKQTLLHLYIVTTAINYYRRDFHKNGDLIDEENIEKWYSLFDSYSIAINKFDFENGDVVFWFDENENIFLELFDKMAQETFYILFANRRFLLAFNNLASTTVKEIQFPAESLTKKGTIKRINIPRWVKIAVFHRDKGRCVFCNTDLTGIINTFTNSNYDHIVPLDLFGVNDPCNIQLTCSSCNKIKTNKEGSTSSKYIPWWPMY